jgi:hypothetical protein
MSSKGKAQAMSTQRKQGEASSRVASRFFWRIARGAPVFLREVANLRNDGFKRFRRRYSPFFDRYKDTELYCLRDELRAVWTGGKQKSPLVAIAWKKHLRSEPDSPLTIQELFCNRWLHRAHGGLLIFWDKRQRFIGPDPYELPALLAYSSHLCGDRLRVCRNRNCQARYFVAARRDQFYCSQDCAAPAIRESKRRSWDQHKGKWPSQRRRKKSSGKKSPVIRPRGKQGGSLAKKGESK